jgi:thiol-disulfide isomerase/thioredoxin
MRIFLAVIMAFMATSLVNAQQQQTLPSQPGSGKSAMTYSQAFKKAQAGDKPLLVMVTAEWCPPCQVMKSSTLPVLLQKNAFQNFHFAMMDYDAESELADKLIGDRGLPQLIMYEQSNGKWLRRYINGKRGIHSVERVESFVAQAGTFRLASNKEEATDKK